MKSVVWKVVLGAVEVQDISVPEGGAILHVGVQRDEICIWFQCNPEAARVTRTIRILGTGHEVEGYPGRYLGTAMLSDGDPVFHIYEVR